MRYTKEFKIESVKKYLNGEYIPDPGGCTHATFHTKVLEWAKIYQCLGEAGLDHNKPKLSFEEKMDMVSRVEAGETFYEVACSFGRQSDYVSHLYKIYLLEGEDGIKSHSKRGRPSKMKKSEKNVEFDQLTPEEQVKVLKKKLEEAELENEYLKKLSALVQKRKAQQRKK